MKDLSKKLRLIYQPFVLIALGFIVVYSVLNWVLFIKGGMPLSENSITIVLPFVLSWVPILIWLRPRLKLFFFPEVLAVYSYCLLASLAIVIPTKIAQEYLATATGGLTELNNISQLTEHSKTKYYSLKNYYVDKQYIAAQTTTYLIGRYRTDFSMHIYIVMPLLENETDVVTFKYKYWLGKRYSKMVPNLFLEQDRIDQYKKFEEQSYKEFERTDFRKATYLEVLGNTSDRAEYKKALRRMNKRSVDDKIIFEATTEPFEARNGDKIFWFFCSLGIGFVLYFIILLFPEFDKNKLEKFYK